MNFADDSYKMPLIETLNKSARRLHEITRTKQPRQTVAHDSGGKKPK